ncbi:Uncharacterised protein [Amycolatopsis camponoti]|uniref:SnoaL-like domain-containing protein n=1 Tax=Amycolatopsis camponoti TaxID=2606593 RepID=A0A6I8LYQ7_9PSEU|nr:Uncharacterised protein [Amycolatopsis camponoti]
MDDYPRAREPLQRDVRRHVLGPRRPVLVHDHRVAQRPRDFGTVSGDTASGRACFTVLQAAPGLPLQTIAAGRYADRFTHAADGWRFTERRVTADLVGDVGRHLRLRP